MGKGRGRGAVEVRALEAVEGGSAGLHDLEGDGSVGTVRGMDVLSSLSVASNHEQLEVLDGHAWPSPLPMARACLHGGRATCPSPPSPGPSSSLTWWSRVQNCCILVLKDGFEYSKSFSGLCLRSHSLQNNTLEGLIPADKVPKFKDKVQEGVVYTIHKFDAIRARQKYKAVDHPWRLCFIPRTLVEPFVPQPETFPMLACTLLLYSQLEKRIKENVIMSGQHSGRINTVQQSGQV